MAKTLFVVGDSTLSSFNDAYFYPRYGYGTQLSKYLNNDIEVCNLAMSGRSSKSFLVEDNYNTLKNNIKSGDFLIIGFGHNDQKQADELRYTSALTGLEDTNSFMYHLYNYYCRVALDVGATPILCTPIVRLNPENDFSKECAHITKCGDYKEAVIRLGKEKNIEVIDLTTQTKNKYLELGYDNAIWYHAMTLGVNGKAQLGSVDTTHLNIYGAKFVAYLVCKTIKDNNYSLANYVLDNIKEPTKDTDLVSNPNYVTPKYKHPDLDNYKPQGQYIMKSEGWYGTAFGDCGGSPKDTDNGFKAYEEDSKFVVGNLLHKGKISLASDGIAFAFEKVEKKYNFTLEADCKVVSNGIKQAGFGLMLRDDCYINQMESSLMINSNYITAGMICNEGNSSVLFYRESSVLNKEEFIIDGLYKEKDKLHLKITRLGQSMKVELEYNNKKYEKLFYDFDCLATDKDYMYIGMFATRGTLCEYTNVKFDITGISEGA